jgi:hypothetical protein
VDKKVKRITTETENSADSITIGTYGKIKVPLKYAEKLWNPRRLQNEKITISKTGVTPKCKMS